MTAFQVGQIVYRAGSAHVETGRVESVGAQMLMVRVLGIGADDEFRPMWAGRWRLESARVATPEDVAAIQEWARLDRLYRTKERELHAARAAEMAPVIARLKKEEASA